MSLAQPSGTGLLMQLAAVGPGEALATVATAEEGVSGAVVVVQGMMAGAAVPGETA